MLTGYIIEKYSFMKDAYTCHRILEEAAKRGVSLQIVGVADTIVTEDGVYHKRERLENCDFVINRYKYDHIKDEIGALAKRTYNETNIFNTYINKYMQVKNLRSEGFLMPKYMLGTGYTDFEVVTTKLGLPFVAKGLESSQGAEVFLIENKEDFQVLCETYDPDKEYLFEEYIAESYGRDIRFYSIRGEVIACMTREAVQGFKANVALGAGVREYPIDDNIRQAAKDIYEQTGLDFLGIDLLFGKDKPYFCEINVMPGIEGMERATGVNVAGAIIDTILGDFKHDCSESN
ncbi:MAG: RimK family alpha-L-glutamate ligase [Lachnospiraceae bacterium]|nr:RimK family alpha-L-glutamate ligase [Lachnospiraceae bacterium]